MYHLSRYMMCLVSVFVQTGTMVLYGLAYPDPEGGRGSGPTSLLKNHKHIGFLSNTGPDSLKNQKVTKPTFNVGPSSETPEKRHLNGRADDGLLIDIWILPPFIN